MEMIQIYLERARECMAQAEGLANEDEKLKMLAVATAWQNFANELSKDPVEASRVSIK